MKKPGLARGAVVWLLAVASPVVVRGAGDVQRGKYLVTRVAMCGQCHTPHDDEGKPEPGRELQGAALQFGPLFAMPWSPAAASIAGLPVAWTEAAVVKLLMTGEGRLGTPLAPPMPQFRMTRRDAEAIVAYLKSLPPPQLDAVPAKPPDGSRKGIPGTP
jgi:mono/diheme cytochrome c family protein